MFFGLLWLDITDVNVMALSPKMKTLNHSVLPSVGTFEVVQLLEAFFIKHLRLVKKSEAR